MFTVFEIAVWRKVGIMISRVGRREQRGLNEKELQVNLCNMFSIFIFNEYYLFA